VVVEAEFFAEEFGVGGEIDVEQLAADVGQGGSSRLARMRGRSDGAKSRPFCAGAAAGLAPPVSAAPSGQRASGRAVAMTAEALRKVRRVDMVGVVNPAGGSEGRNSKGKSAEGWGRAARLRARDGARAFERASSDWGRQGQPKWIG
jgi:hypothetical protein